ncbi:hypothetical protein BDQ17DRAFT_643646 [Cyathus striatus]|nr:hypothetical protein BDQ17DRAFT_643646 [Cyathus striatus]
MLAPVVRAYRWCFREFTRSFTSLDSSFAGMSTYVWLPLMLEGKEAIWTPTSPKSRSNGDNNTYAFPSNYHLPNHPHPTKPPAQWFVSSASGCAAIVHSAIFIRQLQCFTYLPHYWTNHSHGACSISLVSISACAGVSVTLLVPPLLRLDGRTSSLVQEQMSI